MTPFQPSRKRSWFATPLVAAATLGTVAALPASAYDVEPGNPPDYENLPERGGHKMMIEVGNEYVYGSPLRLDPNYEMDLTGEVNVARQIIGIRFQGFEENGKPGVIHRVFTFEGRIGTAFTGDGSKLPFANLRLTPYSHGAREEADGTRISWLTLELQRDETLGIERSVKITPFQWQLLQGKGRRDSSSTHGILDNHQMNMTVSLLSYALTRLKIQDLDSFDAKVLEALTWGMNTGALSGNVAGSLNLLVFLPRIEVGIGGLALQGESGSATFVRLEGDVGAGLEFGDPRKDPLAGRVFVRGGFRVNRYGFNSDNARLRDLTLEQHPDRNAADTGVTAQNLFMEIGAQLTF